MDGYRVSLNIGNCSTLLGPLRPAKYPTFEGIIFIASLLLCLDGDPIKLPENLETLPRAEHFPTQRHRWNTNEVSHTQPYDPNL